jgi:hypothetical protein
MPGWKSLIVCDPVPSTGGDFVGPVRDCDFEALIELVRVLIHDLVLLSTLLAVGVFAYAGIKLLASGGNPGAMKDAKGMFFKVLIGYMWILAAWLIVYTITSVLLHPGYSLLGAPKPN